MTTEKTVEKREYFPPKVVHTEAIEARAVSCALADDTCVQAGGPIQS
jgi:hypothetical protein